MTQRESKTTTERLVTTKRDLKQPQRDAKRHKTTTKGLRTNHKEMPEDKRDGDETTAKRREMAAKRHKTTWRKKMQNCHKQTQNSHITEKKQPRDANWFKNEIQNKHRETQKDYRFKTTTKQSHTAIQSFLNPPLSPQSERRSKVHTWEKSCTYQQNESRRSVTIVRRRDCRALRQLSGNWTAW